MRVLPAKRVTRFSRGLEGRSSSVDMSTSESRGLVFFGGFDFLEVEVLAAERTSVSIGSSVEDFLGLGFLTTLDLTWDFGMTGHAEAEGL